MTTRDPSSVEVESEEPYSPSQHSTESRQRVNISVNKAVDAVVRQGARPHSRVSIVGRKTEKPHVEDYSGFPLLQSMLKYEKERTSFLSEEGKMQFNCPKSTAGWVRTLFILRGRALDWVAFPWCFVVLHATLYTALDQRYDIGFKEESLDDWRTLFTFALNATLGFLLVFRLNRAATRFWVARELWGTIVGSSRNIASSILVHSSHNPQHRDEAIRWVGAFSIACKDFIRGEVAYKAQGYSGILSSSQVDMLQENVHPPMYCVFRVRNHLKQIFDVAEDVNPFLAIAWTQQMEHVERILDEMTMACGGIERIKGTPLPIVYVSHLRTFLLINLLLLPYVWGSDWGWMTIPIVAIAGFAYLGLEAAAAEVEAPFRKDRQNALDMDGYCKTALAGIQQQCLNYADVSLGFDPILPSKNENMEHVV